MWPTFRGWLFLLCALGLIAASPAQARLVLGAGGGWFEPWDGSGDFSVMGQVLASIGKQEKLRIGGEFEYHQFDTRLFGARNIDMQTFALRGIMQFFPMPEWVVQPYAGIGIGTEVQYVDSDEVKEQQGDDIVPVVGSGFSLLGILGAEIPIGDHFSFFAEGRLGYSMLLIIRKDNDSVDHEGTGGAHGLGGFRIRF
ncbi:MAG: hypothetical protein ACQGVK_14880 [Myxococcota bacterium]